MDDDLGPLRGRPIAEGSPRSREVARTHSSEGPLGRVRTPRDGLFAPNSQSEIDLFARSVEAGILHARKHPLRHASSAGAADFPAGAAEQTPAAAAAAPAAEPAAEPAAVAASPVVTPPLSPGGAGDAAESGLSGRELLQELLDITAPLTEGASAIVDDSFNRCFNRNPPENWNWNWYLFPLWVCGTLLRYLVLFPLRLALLLAGFVAFFTGFYLVHTLHPYSRGRRACERRLCQFMCHVFAASWTAAIKYHGPRPVQRANHVFVANHTSMIDYVVLSQVTPFAAIMQLQSGWVRFLQATVLESIGCIGFNRTEAKDRLVVREKLRQHVSDPESPPLLIFPEGTCVNNEYCVMFKRGAFELGATVCPIAIKYNKIFVDAFWKSSAMSFSAHILQLMTSWAVVADVWFLEPQSVKPGETPEAFASRVQAAIAARAGLTIVPWDGYLKYYRPSPALVEKRRRAYASTLRRHLPAGLRESVVEPGVGEVGAAGAGGVGSAEKKGQ